MLIRLARRNEVDELSALVMRAKAHWGYDAAFLEACRDDLRVRSEQIAAGAVWVAELDGMAAGVLELAIADSKAEVRACFVEPHAIDRGVGRALWRHAEALAMAAGASAVSVDSDPFAEGFYLAMGAQRVGEAPSGAIAGRMLPRLAKRLR
jgi:N-acetylglutamate synthase-like GNAT family acetyltransferase